jgi:Amt family ammonium transporter
LIGVATCFVTPASLALLVYFIAEKLVGNRISLEVELEGLDVPEMGVAGYAGMVMDKQAETPVSLESVRHLGRPTVAAEST